MKKKILSLILLIVSTIVFVLGSSTNVQAASSSSRKLTQKELKTITKYLNKLENNGFLQSKYTKPSQINLDMAFRQVTDTDKISKKENKELSKLGYASEIATHKTSVKTFQKLYKKNTGKSITVNQLKKRLNWNYIKKYNAFYTQYGDTAYSPVKAVSGTYKNGKYYVTYKCTNGDVMMVGKNYDDIKVYKKGKVTLKKINKDYRFISNQGVK